MPWADWIGVTGVQPLAPGTAHYHVNGSLDSYLRARQPTDGVPVPDIAHGEAQLLQSSDMGLVAGKIGQHGEIIPGVNAGEFFACSRIAGWAAHYIEQIQHNRIYRPLSRYAGAPLRHVPPIEKR